MPPDNIRFHLMSQFGVGGLWFHTHLKPRRQEEEGGSHIWHLTLKGAGKVLPLWKGKENRALGCLFCTAGLLLLAHEMAPCPFLVWGLHHPIKLPCQNSDLFHIDPHYLGPLPVGQPT